MQQLTNLDASFLSLESRRSPMHIGCILTFDTSKSEKMTFERFQRHVVSRLPSSPVFRRRLSTLPLSLDLPYWIDDRHFDIDNHLEHVELQGIHSEEQCQAFINCFFSEPLNLDNPLWEIMFMENRDHNQSEFYVLLKIHHAAVDGMSAEKILTGLMSAKAGTPEPLQDNWKPESTSITRMLGNRLQSLVKAPKNLSVFTQQLTGSIKSSVQLRRSEKGHSPTFFMSPSTLFNGGIGKRRRLSSAKLSLSDVKLVKNSMPGCTVNDVVMAVCAGALKRHLGDQERLPKSPLVAMIPVSKRAGVEGSEGNLISAMLVSLATNIDSPVARLEKIHQNSCHAKKLNREVAMEKLMTHLPSWSTSLVLKGYIGSRLAKNISPVFNLVITNVPGARVPLYLDGAKLTSMEGMAPIVDGMGLILVVTSYMDTLTIGVTTSAAMSVHASEFVRYLHESLIELKQALVNVDVSKVA